MRQHRVLLQDNLRSPHEYRANATVSAIVQEFLAASIGGYREYIKSPVQQTPQRMPSAAARFQGGMNRLRSKIQESLHDRGVGAQSEQPPPQPEAAAVRAALAGAKERRQRRSVAQP